MLIAALTIPLFQRDRNTPRGSVQPDLHGGPYGSMVVSNCWFVVQPKALVVLRSYKAPYPTEKMTNYVIGYLDGTNETEITTITK